MKISSKCIPNHILKRMKKEDRPKGIEGMTSDEIEGLNERKTEQAIHHDIISFLRRNCIPYDHSRMDRKSTNTLGHPDFSIYMHNRVLFLEIKKQGGKLSEEQIKRIEHLGASGNTVFTCYSYDSSIEKIKEFFSL